MHIELPNIRRVRLIGKPKKAFVAAHAANRPHSSRTPITDAMIELVNRGVPNDPRGRIVADLLAEALFRQALKGNVKAIKEITDRIEGTVPEQPSVKPRISPDNITVIWPTVRQSMREPDFSESESPGSLRSEAS